VRKGTTSVVPKEPKNMWGASAPAPWQKTPT